MRKVHIIFSLSTLLIALTAAAAVTVARGTHSESQQPAPEAAFAQALDEFRAGRHAASYARLTVLADAGHVPSAQLALVMLRNGKAMFGSEWSATQSQQLRWNAYAVNGLRGSMPIIENERGD